MNFGLCNKSFILLATALSLALMLAGCGAKQSRRVEQSGFLGDYSQLTEKKQNEALYVYVNPKADCRKYNKVLLEPTTLWAVSENSALAKLETKDQEMLVSRTGGMIFDAMQKAGFKITREPGSDTIRVRGAVTEATKAKVMLANATAVVPYVWQAATIWGMATGKWPFLGELAGEIEMTDSESGERLFAAVDKVTGTMGANMDPRARWTDVRKGFDLWRERFSKRMVSCHATGSFEMPKDERGWIKKTFDYTAP